MKFYHKGSPWPPVKATYPCVVLMRDKWDDYDYKTTYIARYFPSKTRGVLFGEVKILMRGQMVTALPPVFEHLSDKYCSLGQSLSYYKKILKLGRERLSEILGGVNDVVYDPSIAAAFEDEKGFHLSLSRFSEAQKAYAEAPVLLSDWARVRSNFRFVFTCKLSGADNAHEVLLDFNPDPSDLFRIVALIGRNGTGKTQVLARLAAAASGWDRQTDRFTPDRPNFSKIIAVSYSVFDKFDRPEEGSKSYSYVYCGIRKGNKRLDHRRVKQQANEIYTQAEIEKKLLRALGRVEREGRANQWSKILGELLEEKVTVRNLRSGTGKLNLSYYGQLSSGQRLLVLLMTEVIANITEESLILFDEPETHMHPNALSALVRSFHLLLKAFNSFAVIATHSPIILQEIPGRRVRLFKRDGTYSIVNPLAFESFGENLTMITNEVFEVSRLHNNYQDYLRGLAASKTYDEILEVFEGRLGLNARAFLRSLYGEDEGDQG